MSALAIFYGSELKQIRDGGEGGGVGEVYLIADISNRGAVRWPTRFCAAERTSFRTLTRIPY